MRDAVVWLQPSGPQSIPVAILVMPTTDPQRSLRNGPTHGKGDASRSAPGSPFLVLLFFQAVAINLQKRLSVKGGFSYRAHFMHNSRSREPSRKVPGTAATAPSRPAPYLCAATATARASTRACSETSIKGMSWASRCTACGRSDARGP